MIFFISSKKELLKILCLIALFLGSLCPNASTIALSPAEIKTMLDQEDIELIDVRDTQEFISRHISKAKNIPLSILDLQQICTKTKKIILYCESGRRSQLAAKKLEDLSIDLKIYTLDGGIKNWIEKNYSVIENNSGHSLSLNRQVQITAGAIIVAGALLTLTLSKFFIAVPLFIGCGLIFAGVSGWCGMAKILAMMPWN